MKARRAPPAEYDLLDHTADLGIRVRGRDLADLLAAAGIALADLLYDTSRVEERVAEQVEVEAVSDEELLVRFLNELIYVAEVREFAWRVVEVRVVRPGRISVVLRGERLDPRRHEVRTSLKAATYHLMEITPGPPAWEARVILDV
jgi:SHS2 domain-containing protein